MYVISCGGGIGRTRVGGGGGPALGREARASLGSGSEMGRGGGARMSHVCVQGHLAYKKQPPPRNLPPCTVAYAEGHMVVLAGGGSFL